MADTPTRPTQLGIEDLMACLPHRYPMLLVDRILELDLENGRCVGLKNVTINEPFFQGHYPGKPIMPGVLIIECMAQIGASLLLSDPSTSGLIPLIGAIDDVKFKRMVIPGDQLRVEVQILWVRKTIGRIKCVASVDGDVAATMEMTFKLLENQ